MGSASTRKPKILLDEGLIPRRSLPQLNRFTNVRHIAHDFDKAGVSDSDVYELACREQRIVVTYNGKDFRSLLRQKGPSIVVVSAKLFVTQIDAKLTSLVRRIKPNQYQGKFFSLTGETRR